jgi:hypothetical protein
MQQMKYQVPNTKYQTLQAAKILGDSRLPNEQLGF